MVRVGADRQHRFQIRVPVDDTHTLHFWYSCYRPRDGRPLAPQAQIPVYDVPFRDEQGDFLVDFVDGGDIMTWVTQGADRRSHPRACWSPRTAASCCCASCSSSRSSAWSAATIRSGIVRSPEENRIIELPQERDKYGDGRAFLAESIELSHVRYSPLRGEIARLLEVRPRGAGARP